MSTRDPAVSIVIPAFNAEDTIVATVEAALGQTLADLEVLVIDDGSTDATRARLAALADDRLRVVSGGNQGVAAARNRGLGLARGEFVAFLDADDLWSRDKLQRQVGALRDRPDAGAAYSWTAFVDERGGFLFPKERQRAQGDVYDDLLVDFFLASGSNALARRACVDASAGFAPEFQPVEDWEFWLRVARRWPFVMVPSYQVFYRVRGGSASTRNVERYAERIRSVVERELAQAAPELRGRAGECLANADQHAAGMYLWRSTGPEARGRATAFLARSVRGYPRGLLRVRTWTLVVMLIVAYLLPYRYGPPAARGILRLYGRWAVMTDAELRRQLGALRSRTSR